MFKRIILFSLTLTLVVCCLPFSVAASSSAPTITYPIQYDQIKAQTALTLKWSAPTSGVVSKYIVNVRELSIQGKETLNLIVEGKELSANTKSYTIPASSILAKGYYRASVCAVLSDGTYHYSAERYFFSGNSKGIASSKTISFKIWTGFTAETKNAIYYSTRTWIDTLGVEKVNTYAYSQGVTSDALVFGDGISTVVPTYTFTTGLMATKVTTSTDGYIVEADIVINKNYSWSNNLTQGTYDIQNAMTHEIGHVYGINDRYENYASAWTMYYDADMCEYSKRSLESYDILACKRLNNIT